MGWAEDHRNAVADRWAQKFRDSHLSPDDFRILMRRTMESYGWSEKDIEQMVIRATEKE